MIMVLGRSDLSPAKRATHCAYLFVCNTVCDVNRTQGKDQP